MAIPKKEIEKFGKYKGSYKYGEKWRNVGLLRDKFAYTVAEYLWKGDDNPQEIIIEWETEYKERFPTQQMARITGEICQEFVKWAGSQGYNVVESEVLPYLQQYKVKIKLGVVEEKEDEDIKEYDQKNSCAIS